MENIDLNKFVGGYTAEEVEEAKEKGRELKLAVERLMANPDFKLIFNHYTRDTILDESYKAGYAVEHRPALFESILNRVAFRDYINQLLALQIEE